MKIHKMVCLDSEIVVKLKGENVSQLVNKLLTEHLIKTDDPYALMSTDELEFESAKADIQLKAEDEINKLKRKKRKK